MFIDIVSAKMNTSTQVGNVYEMDDIIRVSISLVVLISGILAVFFIIWGGVMLILSGGKEEKTKPAINSIRYSVIGLIIIFLSIFLSPKIGDMLGLKVSEYVSPDAIFKTIKELSVKFFGSKNDAPIFDSSDSGDVVLPADFTDL